MPSEERSFLRAQPHNDRSRVKADQKPQAVFVSCPSAAAALPTGFFLAPLAIPCDTAFSTAAPSVTPFFTAFLTAFSTFFLAFFLALSVAIVETLDETLSRN
jgi:hypothetical protein